MANSYLSSNTGTATNAKKFTYSVWLKRSKISSEQRFYQGYKDSNNRAYAVFLSSDKLRVYNMTASNIELYWDSTRVFRDTNAWYHIVLSADSTQAAQADRFKVYVNGVEETDFTKSYNPGQNIDWGNQLAQTNGDLTISGTESQTQLFEGYMAHAAFVDGTALTPTSFGETDSTSGIWKFKSPTGITWGDNGYHLKLENSANLGLDSSGNTNNFTVNGDLKQALDTPSNVHATLNPLIKSGYTITYSNGSNKATYPSSGWAGTLSTIGVSSGKWYWEGKMNTTGDNNFFGIMGEGVNMADTSVHNETTGVVIAKGSGNLNVNNTATASYFSALSNGDIFSCALDLDSGTKTIQFYKNGVANGSAVNLPANMQTGFVFPAFVGNASSNAINHEVNFGNGFFGTTAITSAGSNGNGSLFEYDVPSGFYALNTRNINTHG
jgi:hypothetical protein